MRYIYPLLAPPPQEKLPADRLLDGLALVLLLILVGVCLMAALVALAALLPNLSRRSQAALSKRPWRAFFIGLANYIFLGAISLVLFNLNIDLLGLLGLLILTFLFGVTLLGLPGLAWLTGGRLAQLRQQEMSAFKQLVWGTITLELAALLPVLGWFLLTPILLMTAFGAAVLAWRHPRQLEPEDNPPV